MRRAALALLAALAGCVSAPKQERPPAPILEAPTAIVPGPEPAPVRGKGAYYKDDGPGENPPPNLSEVPDAVPRAEPLNRYANRPYTTFGKTYVPLAAGTPFRQTGIGSWYGRRFHGAPTSSGERYDMYAMTAAHPTLPIPSYARVTNLANGRSVVVRINDRGPFHSDRVIDLSYVAALRLGYVDNGSARVEVEALLPGAAPPQLQEAKAADGGIFVQLGAFSARDAAESLRARALRELAWLAQAVQVVASGALYRLQVGPYRTLDEARSIADRIQSELSLRPVIVGR